MQELKFNKDKWKKVSLGDIVFEPKETAKSIFDEGVEHIVGLEHIDSNDIHLRKSFSADTDTTFTKIFRQGDVLFGRRRAYLKKAAQAKFDGVCSGDITVLRAKENIDSRLLPFIIHNDKFFDYAIKHSAGGLSPRVKFKDLANYEFLLPPKEQQAELADLLWAMDEVIEKDLLLLKKLQINKNLLFKKLMDDGKYLKIQEVCDKISSGGTPNRSISEYFEGTIPWLKTSELNNDEIWETEEKITEKAIKESSVKLYPKDTVFVAMYGVTVGKSSVSRIELTCNQACCALVPNKKIINEDYLLINVRKLKQRMIDLAVGSAQPNINSGIIKNLKIFVPSLEFQLKIVRENKIYNDLTNTINKKMKSSKALQKSLINQIF